MSELQRLFYYAVLEPVSKLFVAWPYVCFKSIASVCDLNQASSKVFQLC